MFTCTKVSKIGGLSLAQSVRHETLNLRAASSSLTLGVEPNFKKFFLTKKKFSIVRQKLPIPVIIATRLSKPVCTSSRQGQEIPACHEVRKGSLLTVLLRGREGKSAGKSLGQEASNWGTLTKEGQGF